MSRMCRGWLHAWLACLVMFAGRVAAADGEPSVGQKQALFAKPSVVRVVGVYEVTFQVAGREMKQYLGGTGSGFFVSGDGYIATNAHVVKVIKEGEQAAKDGALQQLLRELDRDYATELSRMSRTELVQLVDEIKKTAKATPTAQVILPDGTKLDYIIKAYGAPIGQGKDVSIIKVETTNAPNLTVGDSDFVTVQDHLIAIGYPGAADMTGLLDTKSLLEASITEGSVSAIKRTTDGEPVLQVQVPITHGNSGGPAINDKGEVVGLTTFGSKEEVQGFNFLVASSTVMKFVKEAKADNTPSKTNVLWRKALGEMWAGDLDPAIADFEEVMTLARRQGQERWQGRRHERWRWWWCGRDRRRDPSRARSDRDDRRARRSQQEQGADPSGPRAGLSGHVPTTPAGSTGDAATGDAATDAATDAAAATDDDGWPRAAVTVGPGREDRRRQQRVRQPTDRRDGVRLADRRQPDVHARPAQRPAIRAHATRPADRPPARPRPDRHQRFAGERQARVDRLRERHARRDRSGHDQRHLRQRHALRPHQQGAAEGRRHRHRRRPRLLEPDRQARPLGDAFSFVTFRRRRA
jgi:serine protease Do